MQTIKTADTEGLYTALDEHRKLTLSQEISKEYKIYSVCYIWEIRATQILWRGRRGDSTLVSLQHKYYKVGFVLYCTIVQK